MKTAIACIISIAIQSIFYDCSTKDSEEIVIETGVGIRHDDFNYIVDNFEINNFITKPGDSTLTKGNFYVIHFKVVNNAGRVSHRWDNSVAYIIDAKGKVYENNPELQQQLNKVAAFGWKSDYTTLAETTDSTVFVFELPPLVKRPYLKFRGNMLMGDMLDGNKFKRTRVKLF